MWILLAFVLLFSPLIAHAETKIIVANGTYTMGDGETPSFAEAMALQKAKQMALEHAGTYVESYTKVQNYNLTSEEVQTIAGGVLQVEVLDKSRTLIGEGLRFYIKIKATVATDKMEELAQRIKGKNVAEEYKKLQEDYTRLNKEIEGWKQLIVKTPSGPEREAAMDQIRQREKAFKAVQMSEATFFASLISGEDLVRDTLEKKAHVDRFLQRLVEEGYGLDVGPPTASPSSNTPNVLAVSIRITLKTSTSLFQHLVETTKALGGVLEQPQGLIFARVIYNNEGHNELLQDRFVGSKVSPTVFGALVELTNEPNLAKYFHDQLSKVSLILEMHYADGSQSSCSLSSDKLSSVNLFVPVRKLKDFSKRSMVTDRPEVFLGGRVLSVSTGAWQPDSVALLFDTAEFPVEWDLPTERAEKLEKVTTKFSLPEQEKKEEYVLHCRIGHSNGRISDEEFKKRFEEVVPKIKAYKQALSHSKGKKKG